MSNKPTSGETRTLITVPEFATIDEIAAAIVLARLYHRMGYSYCIYLGDKNYSKRIQKLFPSEDLKFFHSQATNKEFMISLPVAKDSKIKSLKWEQLEAELKIYIESGNFADRPNIDFKRRPLFGKIFMLGGSDVKRVEDWKKLHLQDITNVDYLNSKEQTVCELVFEVCMQDNWELNQDDLKFLGIGAMHGKIINGEINRPVNQDFVKKLDESGINNNLNSFMKIEPQDFNAVAGFWAGEGRAETEEEFDNLLSLIKITPQLNPLIPNFGGFIENKAGGKRFERSVSFGTTTFFISDDLRFQPSQDVSIYYYRRFKDFLMGWFKSKQEQMPMVNVKSTPVSKKLTEKTDREIDNVEKTENEPIGEFSLPIVEESKENPQSSSNIGKPAEREAKPAEYIPLAPAKI